MRLPGDDGKRSNGHSVFYMILAVSAFVVVVLFTVMQNNQKEEKKKEAAIEAAIQQTVAAETEIVEPEPEPEQKLRAEDLDFWDMYPVEEKPETQTGKQDVEAPKEDEEEESHVEKKEEVVQEDPSPTANKSGF